MLICRYSKEQANKQASKQKQQLAIKVQNDNLKIISLSVNT